MIIGYAALIGLGVGIELLLFATIRWRDISREDRRIREWQATPSEKQPEYLEGYATPEEEVWRYGRFVARVYLLGFLPIPERVGLKVSAPDNRRLSKRVTEISYRPWIRAISRVVWREESTDSGRGRESRLLVLIFSAPLALCAAVALLLALRGAYYLSALLWAHSGLYIALATVVGAVVLYRRWRP